MWTRLHHRKELMSVDDERKKDEKKQNGESDVRNVSLESEQFQNENLI
jgi:hypothetical protein